MSNCFATRVSRLALLVVKLGQSSVENLVDRPEPTGGKLLLNDSLLFGFEFDSH
jgi:hypothetical protein